MHLIDTHAHLDDEAFDADIDEVVARAVAAGVEKIITIGISAETSEAAVALARKYDSVYAAVGIQPNYAGQAAPGDFERVVRLLDEPKVVAVGETGLDFYRDFSPADVQRDYFDRHLRLAQDRSLPAIIHTRQSTAETLAMLREARRRGPLAGVMHSFSAGVETAAECVELGLCISFAGMVTFKKAADLRAVAAAVAGDRILIETDSPYLSPVPFRGKRNEPARLVHTAQCLAEARGQTSEEFAAATTANAKRLFGL